jgi:hypothetical protein
MKDILRNQISISPISNIKKIKIIFQNLSKFPIPYDFDKKLDLFQDIIS